MRIFSIFLLLLFLAIFISCNKKDIKAETPVQPQIQFQRTLTIIPFVNNTDDASLSKEAVGIPDFLRMELMQIRKIKLPKEHVLITNIDQVATYLIKKDRERYYRGQENFDRTNDYNISGDKIRREKYINELKNLNNNDEKIIEYEYLSRERWFFNKVKDKLKNDDLSRKKVLDDFFSRATPEEQEKFTLAELKVLPTKYKGKAFNGKNIFDLGVLYERLKKGTNSDLFLVGMIQKRDSNIAVIIKGYDSNTTSFFFHYEETFTPEELSMHWGEKMFQFSEKFTIAFQNLPQGVIEINTKPKKAIVYMDGLKIGETNFQKSVAIGQHTVEILKKDFTPIKGTIDIKEKKLYKIEYDLKKYEEFGNITVSSTPSLADVYLDLEYIGKTPITKKNIPVGFYKVRIEKEGYAPKIAFANVASNKTFQVKEKLILYDKDLKELETRTAGIRKAKNLCIYTFFLSLGSYLVLDYEANRLDDLVEENKAQSPAVDSPKFKMMKKYDKRKSRVQSTRDIFVGLGIVSFGAAFILQWVELEEQDIPIGMNIFPELNMKIGILGPNAFLSAEF